MRTINPRHRESLTTRSFLQPLFDVPGMFPPSGVRRNILIAGISTAVITVVTILGGIISARLLLPEGKGTLTAVMLWPSLLAALGALGIPDAVGYFAARDKERTSQVLSSGVAISFLVSVPLIIAGYLLMPILLPKYSINVIHLARVYLLYIPLNLLAVTFASSLAGRLKMAEYNVVRITVHLVFVATMPILYALGIFTFRTLAFASLFANLVALTAAFLMTKDHRWLQIAPSRVQAWRLVQYGIKGHIGSITSFANQRLDQLLMSILLPPVALGLYVVAVTVAAVTHLGVSTIAMVAFPHLANIKCRATQIRQLIGYLKVGFLLTVASGVLIWLCAPWVVSFFFGKAFTAAVGPSRILTIAGVLLGCNTLLSAGFKAFGMPLTSSHAELVGLVVTVIALAALLKPYQLLGAAWASLIAYASSFLFLSYSLYRLRNNESTLEPAVTQKQFDV